MKNRLHKKNRGEIVRIKKIAQKSYASKKYYGNRARDKNRTEIVHMKKILRKSYT